MRPLRRFGYRIFWWPVCLIKGHDWRDHYSPWSRTREGGWRSTFIHRWCTRCGKRVKS